MKLNSHISVLLDKVLETLGDISGATIIDATFGAGGYSRAFLERGANVIAFDRDSTVQKFADVLINEYPGKFEFINRKFSDIRNIEKPVSHVVFDFGVSSMQIDTPERGFSWRFDAPLDMRMGDGETVLDLIEQSSSEDIANILREYGDVRKAVIIARAIKSEMPKTTFALRDLIYNPNDIAPVFQALRIAVNDELGEIERALDSVPKILVVGGKCVCVTFHSLEDRLVKAKFRKWATPLGDPRFPLAPPEFSLLRAYRPDDAELGDNPRSRSSHLRAVQKNGTIDSN